MFKNIYIFHCEIYVFFYCLKIDIYIYTGSLEIYCALFKSHFLYFQTSNCLPYFLYEHTNSKCAIVPTFISQMAKDEINYPWFQQDSTTTHSSHRSMQFLETFLQTSLFPKMCGPHTHQTFLSMGRSKIHNIVRSSAQVG